MKLNFCTLFDSNYLTRGVAMYESLLKHCPNFHLYIFAFDDIAVSVLKKLNLKNVSVISLPEFENEELLAVKANRSRAEYCWTCTPSIIYYSIEKFKLDSCTYLDADLFFYSNPQVLFEEMRGSSVLITEHRYSPTYDQTTTSGKYCVQFMVFKNDKYGMEVLKWWKTACLAWCFARPEDGKFGDQKYLDDWTSRFEKVHVLEHLGGGVAPWNVQEYNFHKKNNQLYLNDKISKKPYKLIFYHFHELKFFLNDIIRITSFYFISPKVLKLIYAPYIKMLFEIKMQILNVDKTFDPAADKQLSRFTPFELKDKIHLYKEAILKFNFEEIRKTRKQILSHNYFYINFF